MDNRFENFKALISCLSQDVHRCFEELDSSIEDHDYKFWATQSTRSVFAAIAGMSEFLSAQAFVAEKNKVTSGEISVGKLSVLAGESYFVDDNGEIHVQPVRIKFLNQVLFSLNAYAEGHGVDYRTKKDTAGWKSLKAAVIIRDRTTHPKDVGALEMSRADVAEVMAAFQWFHNELAEILRAKGCDIPPLSTDS